MVGHGGSSAGSYLADSTSPIPWAICPIPSHCASIVATSTVRVNKRQWQNVIHFVGVNKFPHLFFLYFSFFFLQTRTKNMGYLDCGWRMFFSPKFMLQCSPAINNEHNLCHRDLKLVKREKHKHTIILNSDVANYGL